MRAALQPLPSPRPSIVAIFQRLWRAARADWLAASLLLFMAGALLLPDGPAYALIFYLVMLPCAVVAAGAASRWDKLRDTGVRLAIGLILWSGLSLLWGEDDLHRAWSFAAQTIWTLGFLLALVWVLQDAVNRRRLGSLLIGVGAANAALSILLFYTLPHDSWRLHGWGLSRNPILGASVMAGPMLCALSRALSEGPRRLAYLAVVAVTGFFILHTESRGPILASGVAGLFLCLASPMPRRALGGIILLMVAWARLPAAWRRQETHQLVARGASHRFDIWRHTLAAIAQRPIFGHGLAANLHMPAIAGVGPITFPHNLYLSVLFYSGAVGLGLFGALALLVSGGLWQGWRGRDADWLWMAGLWLVALISGLTDLGQITKGPSEIWFILWLPVGLVLAAGARTRGAWPQAQNRLEEGPTKP